MAVQMRWQLTLFMMISAMCLAACTQLYGT